MVLRSIQAYWLLPLSAVAGIVSPMPAEADVILPFVDRYVLLYNSLDPDFEQSEELLDPGPWSATQSATITDSANSQFHNDV